MTAHAHTIVVAIRIRRRRRRAISRAEIEYTQLFNTLMQLISCSIEQPKLKPEAK
jgi:hypothetical protein